MILNGELPLPVARHAVRGGDGHPDKRTVCLTVIGIMGRSRWDQGARGLCLLWLEAKSSGAKLQQGEQTREGRTVVILS